MRDFKDIKDLDDLKQLKGQEYIKALKEEIEATKKDDMWLQEKIQIIERDLKRAEAIRKSQQKV